ncbi:MAG: flagellar biosynthetic protein FliO [Isosphaeraceae bacterium]
MRSAQTSVRPGPLFRAAVFLFVPLSIALAGVPSASSPEDQRGEPAPAPRTDRGAPAEIALLRVPPPSRQTMDPGRGPGREAEGTASSWWLAPAAVVALLAACGVICVGARKRLPGGATSALEIVGRVSLSPRHSIVLVRAGHRTLMIGLGAQSAPSLLGELPGDGPTGAAAGSASHRGAPGLPPGDDWRGRIAAIDRPTVDIRLGDEE